MSTIIESIERRQLKRVPRFDPGDRVRVHFQVVEGTRRRTQVFEGIVIARRGSGVRETFTVRKQSFGVGVERTFPLHSPKIERLEVVARGAVRRAKLYYLRDRVGKRARVAERRWSIQDDVVIAAEAEPVALDSEGEAQEEVEPVAPEEDREATEAAEAADSPDPEDPGRATVPADAEGAQEANAAAEETGEAPSAEGPPEEPAAGDESPGEVIEEGESGEPAEEAEADAEASGE